MTSGTGERFGTKPAPKDGPVRPGDFVEVTAKSEGPLYWKADGEKGWKLVGKDPRTGKRGVRVPHGVRGITIADRKYPDPTVVWFKVVEELP